MDVADQAIKVLDYILSSPLLIGAAIVFGVIFVATFAVCIWHFVKIGKSMDRHFP